jgi:phosphoribosyl 1,2-cyclic phosphodiesterase
MQVRFWGTRGSLPKPGTGTTRYGGNTSCVEVRTRCGELIVLDCGTGVHDLGQALLAGGPKRGHLLITHTHWDHIQGFPFFAPLFEAQHQWDFYAPGYRERNLEQTLDSLMSYDHSPINLDAIEAQIRFRELVEGEFDLGDVRVTTRYLNHPALTLGYRIEADGATLVYATDYEPHFLHGGEPVPGATPIHIEDQRHVEFLAGADLVIHDAQYLLSEFPQKSGWGHTPVESAVDYALAAGVRRLALTHHDPDRNDAALDQVSCLARERMSAGPAATEVFSAAEGMTIELGEAPVGARHPIAAEGSAILSVSRSARRAAKPILLVDDDPDMLLFLQAAIAPEEVRTITASDGRSALEIARRERPSLVVLDLQLPDTDGVEVCRKLRASGGGWSARVPILILTGSEPREEALAEAFRAGVTDYLTKPIKPTLVRSRVRAWLVRAAAL